MPPIPRPECVLIDLCNDTVRVNLIIVTILMLVRFQVSATDFVVIDDCNGNGIILCVDQ